MTQKTISNGETGLIVRNSLNDNFTEIYDNMLNMQFSVDGSTSWHNTYTSADNYFRVSRDAGASWGDAVDITPVTPSSETQVVYTITLPTSTTVAGRIAGAVEGTDYPTGWVLAAGSSPVDIDIEHSLSRRVASVTVFAVDGTQEQQLFNTAAYNGVLTSDADNLTIASLATIQKEIKIYIVFV